MTTIFNAIEALFADQDTKDLFIAEGLTPPERVIVYNREYEEEEADHMPPRPYLSIQFDRHEWAHEDGVKQADIPVIVHVVQDVISFEEKQEDLLQYPELVVSVLDELAISGDVLEHQESDPDHDSRHYFVKKERFMILARR
ncbi:MAG: hypothetical protein RIC30_09440 [Marinoscillum sp.]|uniref:hypothetical protein n=1 Tax=Marinoscillum sp. TaxID=2024838 RepID=UPI0032F6DE08